MHSRRARPTLRLLREDLTSQWDNPSFQRALDDGRLEDLHPLSELPHPIVRKAAESFGENPHDDNFVMPIKGISDPKLLEIKNTQWRGGVWHDPVHNVCWLVVAGLAKGGHEDHDDFYKIIGREAKSGDPQRWLPNDADIKLLKRETAPRLRTEWELDIEAEVLAIMQRIRSGESERIRINHMIPSQGLLSTLEITYAEEPSEPEDDDSTIPHESVLVEFFPENKWAGGHLHWQLVIRTLTSLFPPEQSWDRYGETYSNILEPGDLARRASELSDLVQEGVLAESEAGTHSHYAHKEHIASHAISGRALRSMCGSYFVPTQDHGSLPACPRCHDLYTVLPKL